MIVNLKSMIRKIAPSKAPSTPVPAPPPDRSKQKPGLSFTQLSTFLRCPRQYDYRYRQRLPLVTTGTLLQGRIYHSVAERNYRQKVQSSVDLPEDELTGQCAEWFDEAVRIEEVDFENQDPATLKEQAVELVRLYTREIATAVRPALVEKPFRLSLGAEFPYDLTGRWDVIDADGVIIDNKVFAKTPSQADLDADLQLTLYALAYRLLFQEEEAALRIDAAVKTKEPKVVQLRTTRTNAECRWLLRLIEEAVDAIERGACYPNPGWQCRYCAFSEGCLPPKSSMEAVT
jgi:CRISPR/Cas system-associated exonuclease Cas4 (RecB family)